MNHVRKNVIFCVLFLALTLSVGCAGERNNEPSQEEIPSGAEGVEENGVPENALQIRFWYATSGAGASAMEEIIRDFNALRPEYVVLPTVFGSYTEITAAVRTALTTGNAPDLVVLERDVSIDLRQKGLTLDLTESLQNDEAFDENNFSPSTINRAFRKTGGSSLCRCTVRRKRCTIIKRPLKRLELFPGRFPHGWNWRTRREQSGTRESATMAGNPCGAMKYGWEYWYHTMDDALNGVAGGYTDSSGDQADVDFEVVGMMEQPAWKDGQTAAPEAMAFLLNVMSASAPDVQEGACALIRYLIDAPAQVKWTTRTGYIAVNQTVLNNREYRDYVKRNPYAKVPLLQSVRASVFPYDPTGGAVRDALRLAANRVEIEGISAQDALDEAQRTAQRALDAILNENAARNGDAITDEYAIRNENAIPGGDVTPGGDAILYGTESGDG